MITISVSKQMAETRRCAEAVLEAVPAAMRVIRRMMRAHRLPGMSVPQFRTLAILEREGPATLSRAAEHVGTTLPSMSRLIQSLVEEQLVRRHAGAPDRRTICLEITARGKKLLQAARSKTVGQLAERMNELEDQEIAELWRTMPLLLKLAGEERGAAVNGRGSRC